MKYTHIRQILDEHIRRNAGNEDALKALQEVRSSVVLTRSRQAALGDVKSRFWVDYQGHHIPYEAEPVSAKDNMNGAMQEDQAMRNSGSRRINNHLG